ncbi:hypothetical protein [Streptomyces noursei]|uniref:hypothetical protein n=1 Tax=Streptomyces noursei TaxID=1971 RepID=UPI0016782481|nr:hypothetical protein [Streptomyces noursei]MCZ1014404.1 hypothetical protein [Streptomyces noursei]GGW94765.1 hypothetical protein GCM10010341_14900 [Streptomyces noursei]
MTTPAPLPTARAAAHRAYVLANMARDRSTNHPACNALLAIADYLDVAALAFQTEPPSVFNGITITNEIPADAWLALHDAENTAREHPCTGFPTTLGQYVTQPVFRNELTRPAPTGPAHVTDQRVTALVAALDSVHGLITPDSDQTLVDVMLGAAFALHAELADTGRPGATAHH